MTPYKSGRLPQESVIILLLEPAPDSVAHRRQRVEPDPWPLVTGVPLRDRRRADSWKGQSALTFGRLPGSASRNGRSRWFIGIHSTDRDSWRCCRRDAFRVDARLGRRVRQNVYGDLAGPPEMERVAGSVRAPL